MRSSKKEVSKSSSLWKWLVKIFILFLTVFAGFGYGFVFYYYIRRLFSFNASIVFGVSLTVIVIGFLFRWFLEDIKAL